jgi:hypothetical protein
MRFNPKHCRNSFSHRHVKDIFGESEKAELSRGEGVEKIRLRAAPFSTTKSRGNSVFMAAQQA